MVTITIQLYPMMVIQIEFEHVLSQIKTAWIFLVIMYVILSISIVLV